MKGFILLFLCLCFLDNSAQKMEGLVLTPPMGWNSWNKFQCSINEKIIRGAADAMVSSGLSAVGYQYVVIDDCWQESRDSLGFIVADPQRFPSGMESLGAYIHSRGLKFGIYSCVGKRTCQEKPGSRGHEFQDAMTYAKWGVDYLKLDWCNSDGQNAIESYTLMRDALYSAHRPIVFSICEWGLNKPWEWAKDVGHLWRTTGDITNNWNIPDAKNGKCWGGGVVINLDMQQGLEQYAGPGHWNDPDMLEVGNGELTDSEGRSHFSLWCMLAAPLMAGNDLSDMDTFTKFVLTNMDVISIDQDRLGKQGFKIKDYGEFEIYAKPLYNGDIALCLFNRYSKKIKISFDWLTLEAEIFIDSTPAKKIKNIDRKDFQISGNYSVRDLWTKKELGKTVGSLKAEIVEHDVLLLRLTKLE